MKYIDPADSVFLPAHLCVSGETAELLREMAREMGVSVDEVLSCLAEDAVIDLATVKDSFDDVYIPDKCSTEDLIRAQS